MLPINILFLSTPAERGGWSVIQESGREAIS